MTDLSTDPMPLAQPGPPEMNVYRFFEGIADQVTEVQQEILEHLVAAGTARGWFPDVEAVVARVAEHEPEESVRGALAGLQRLRLLRIEDGGRIHSIVGGITHHKTHLRAMTDDNVPFHLLSSLDALTIAPTLQKPVTVQTTCGQTGQDIELRFGPGPEITDSSPRSVTAFIPGWDGRTPLAEALGPRGWFFAGDEQLQVWMAAQGEPDGLPLTQDTLRMVGLEMASALGALYVKVSVR